MRPVQLFRYLLAVVLLVGCADTSDSVTTSDDPKSDPTSGDSEGTIGVSLLTLKNPFFMVIGDNIKAEAAKHGYSVTVLGADESPEKQSDQVKDFINSGVAAIVLSPCDTVAVGPVIKEANAHDIPVFTVDIPCELDDVKIVCQIATDNYGGGKEAGKAMIEALGEAGGKVAVLHYAQAQSCQLRVKGFEEEIAAHNQTADGKIDIVTILEGGAKAEKSAAVTDDILQSHSDLDGIFAINDPSALGAYAALERAGKADQVTIVGFDGQPDAKQAIKDGKIYADPIQFPDKMGVEVVKTIVNYSLGEDVPEEILIPTYLYKKEDAEKDPSLH